MKDKEWLLSFDCPLRFIFSHSALKEGWDNPNVFQVCTLIDQKSVFTCRQKVGRGLRLIIPTVYRNNYLMSLKGLSHNGITDAFIKTIDFAQKYTYSITWSDATTVGDLLKSTNAFTENIDDESAILKLPKNV